MKLHAPLAVACFFIFGSSLCAQQDARQGATKAAELSSAQPGPARDADLLRLVELIGANQASEHLTQQVMSVKNQFTARTLALTDWRRETFQSALARKIQTRFTPAAVAARWAPILARHFTPEEIKVIVLFYESAAGRKFLAEQPAILREAFAAIEDWRRQTTREIVKEMEAEFPGARETEQALQATSQKP